MKILGLLSGISTVMGLGCWNALWCDNSERLMHFERQGRHCAQMIQNHTSVTFSLQQCKLSAGMMT